MEKKEKKNDFSTISYKLHKNHFKNYLSDKERIKHSKTWLKNDTIDAWRHRRLRKLVNPIIHIYPKSSWLTVGDGRYGSDAHYLESKDVKVLASDISDTLLKIGKKKGFIKQYKRENAEKLSFKNGEFDFVFCKESYHHFPRPMVALYEMLRVAKRGVVLIEPNDTRSVMKGYKFHSSFERSGNYVYKISEREIEKVALGLQLSTVAFKGIDDYYIKGVEYEKLDGKSLLFLKIRFMLFVLEAFYVLRLRQRNILCAMIFKTQPSAKLVKKLLAREYKVINLAKNPYIKEK